MFKKNRSGSTTSTKAATIRTTTSSELSFSSTSNDSRVGATTSSVSDASTTMSTVSMDDSLTPPPHRFVVDPCPIIINDTVDVIDELYEFFGNEIDTRALEFSECQFQQRERVLRELLDSENLYMSKLQAAIEHYKKPMMSHFRQPSTGSTASSSSLPRNFLSNNKGAGQVRGNEFEVVFGNLEDLLNISRKFLNNLKERFRIWGPTQLLSDVIHTLLLDIPAYVTYYENYGTAMSVLEKLARTPATKKFVETVIDGQPSLFSLLGQPLYTISRYTQLLSELVRYTDPHHPDAQQLSQCSYKMNRFENSVRLLLQNCQNVSRLVDMSLLVRNCPLLLDEPRRFIMRGQMTSLSSNGYGVREDRRMYFLLSDQLIFARPREDSTPSPLFYKGKVDLRDATLKTVPKKRFGHPYCFEISIDASDPNYKYADDINALLAAAGGATSQVFYFKTDSEEALAMWMNELQNVIDQLKSPGRRR